MQLFLPPRTYLTSDLIWLQPEKKIEQKKINVSGLPVWSWNEIEEKMAPLSAQHLEG